MYLKINCVRANPFIHGNSNVCVQSVSKVHAFAKDIYDKQVHIGNKRYQINYTEAKQMKSANDKKDGIFRKIIRLSVSSKLGFSYCKSNELLNILRYTTKYAKYAITVIGFIALFGFAIGLISLVWVLQNNMGDFTLIDKAILYQLRL